MYSCLKELRFSWNHRILLLQVRIQFDTGDEPGKLAAVPEIDVIPASRQNHFVDFRRGFTRAAEPYGVDGDCEP